MACTFRFVIMDSELRYYASNRMEEPPLGKINMLTCSVKVDADIKDINCFAVITPSRIYHVKAESGTNE